MNIALISSEMKPYAETGGLADVLESLSNALADIPANRVSVIAPAYQDIFKKNLPLLGLETIHTRLAGHLLKISAWQLQTKSKGGVFFLGVNNLFDRSGLYGYKQGLYKDNAQRFAWFSYGCLEWLKNLGFHQDVLHCHEWQIGLVPVYLKQYFGNDPFYKNTAVVFTIHNIGYPGLFEKSVLPDLGVDSSFFSREGFEYYGKGSFLKAGIVFSDQVTTVSPTYAKEIQGKELGYGFEGILSKLSRKLGGILNGIAPDQWDSKNDVELDAPFGLGKMIGKKKNKASLQKMYKLDLDPKVPLISMVTRLVDQKGLDILSKAWEGMMSLGVQVVMLGTGEKKYEDELKVLAKRHPSRFAADISFDRKKSKQIYAGSDLFLMPSLYEPCGLSQMICLCYGTIPVVRRTGGLADSIVDYNMQPDQGYGFMFKEYTSTALLEAVQRAIKVYVRPRTWTTLVKRAMTQDFSWKQSAQAYMETFHKAVQAKQA